MHPVWDAVLLFWYWCSGIGNCTLYSHCLQCAVPLHNMAQSVWGNDCRQWRLLVSTARHIQRVMPYVTFKSFWSFVSLWLDSTKSAMDPDKVSIILWCNATSSLRTPTFLDCFLRDLDPLQAPLWCARVMMTDNPQCLLGRVFGYSILYFQTLEGVKHCHNLAVISGDYLEEFVQICRRKESNDQLLGKSVIDAHTPGKAHSVAGYSSQLLIHFPFTNEFFSNHRGWHWPSPAATNRPWL